MYIYMCIKIYRNIFIYIGVPCLCACRVCRVCVCVCGFACVRVPDPSEFPFGTAGPLISKNEGRSGAHRGNRRA